MAEPRSWTKEEAKQAIAACDESGMTTSAFARMHGSTAGRFQYWRKRLRIVGGVGERRLLPVRVVEPGQARLVERAPGRVVVSEGRLRIEIEGMAAEWVASLVRLLRESGE